MIISFEHSRDGGLTSGPLERATRQWVTEAAIDIGEAAVLLAPVDTGRLRGSITWATKHGRSSPRTPATDDDRVSPPEDEYTAHVGTNVEYAPFVEYGSKRSPRQSFLRPAVDARREVLAEHYRRLIDAAYSKG